MIRLLAPAKLNLFLHVTGVRPDGYHTLESVFVPVDLADELEVREAPDLVREGDLTGPVEADLCVKAARLLQQACGVSSGARIRLVKRIPVGAGMGGGSSDAAATLLALNRLWRLSLDEAGLRQLAARLGADVPFFIRPEPSWVSGIGEVVEPIAFPETAFTVVYPGLSQSTARIFSSPHLTFSGHAHSREDFARAVADGTWFALGRNDLEAPARESAPEVRAMLERYPVLRLTGSGSAAFAPARLLPPGTLGSLPRGWRHFSVKTFRI